MRFAIAPLALSFLVSCGGTSGPRNGSLVAPPPTPAEVARGKAIAGGAPAAGVPHAQIIDRVAVSPDGRAALTRDGGGGWRVWAALDGSAQPQLLPARGAREGSIARTADGGALVAVIDSAGGLKLFRADARGVPTAVPLSQQAADGRKTIAASVLAGGKEAVVLRDDHSVLLVGAGGEVRSKLEERGFRPTALLTDASGATIVAVSVEPGTQKHDVVIHRLSITRGPTSGVKLGMAPMPARLQAAAALQSGMLSLNPAGTKLSFFEIEVNAASWKLVVVDLADGTSKTIDVPFPSTEQVAAGFLDDDTLVASSMPSAASWRVELGAGGEVYPYEGIGSQFGAASPQAFASGVRVAGYGTWLYVQNDREHLYLGYDRFEALSGAISPGNKWAAWVSNGNGIYIRGLAGGAPKRVLIPNRDQNTIAQRAMFLDDDHLLVIDSTGSLRLLDWRTGEELAATDTGSGDAELDATRGLLRVTRPGGQTWLYRVSLKDGLEGPFIAGDGAPRGGILAGTRGEVLWTLDNNNKLRTYTLAELQRGLSRKVVDARGVVLEHGAPSAVDRGGRFYLFQNDGKTNGVKRYRGPKRTDLDAAYELPITVGWSLVQPSPKADRVALLRGDGVVSVYRSTGGKAEWTRAFVAALYGATWSDDGSMIAVSGHLGAAVIDAKTGSPVDVTCGPWFEVRRTAPSNAFGVLQQPSICESPWTN